MLRKIKQACNVIFPGVLFCFFYLPLYSQIELDTSFTAEQLVDKFLVGQGIKAGNITYTGPRIGIGYFKNESGITGIESGIILSTGSVFNANGPNNSPFITTSFTDPRAKKRPK